MHRNFRPLTSLQKSAVIPAKAGIQMKDVNPVCLDPRLRGGDGKSELVSGLTETFALSRDDGVGGDDERCLRYLVGILAE